MFVNQGGSGPGYCPHLNYFQHVRASMISKLQVEQILPLKKIYPKRFWNGTIDLQLKTLNLHKHYNVGHFDSF